VGENDRKLRVRSFRPQNSSSFGANALSEEFFLRMENITKRFSGVTALDKAELTLKKGEIHALVGENGAGKTTLMRILFGMIQPDNGTVIHKAKIAKFRSSNDALNAGICMIHQEMTLVPGMNIAENIWIGREKLFKKFGQISMKKMNQATTELLEKLDINLPIRTQVKYISVANMQLVELARAVSYHSELIIMDEPTSALSSTEIDKLFTIMQSLSVQGVTIVFISHKIDEVLRICSRITIMRDGNFIKTVETSQIDKRELIRLIVGREVKELFPKTMAAITDNVLEVRDLTRRPTFQHVSFVIHKGEVLGFCGLVGSGRTEIMRAIFGIDKFDSGELLIEGRPTKIGNSREAIRNGIAMVTEDRLRLGIIPNMTVKANTSLAYLERITGLFDFIRLKKESADCLMIKERLNIKFASFGQAVKSLSGGNQQKVMLGRWLLTEPKVLILDEPTRGIDVGSKAEIHGHINSLTEHGVAVILVSSEMPEVLGMSDRILVVRQGRIVSEHLRGEVDQTILMNSAFGV
jgi:ABC-type sugar transport system ATPase subunit